jgi:ABC-type oligopeptide transport system ATPase subunit
MTGALLELAHVSKTFTRGGLLSSRRIHAVLDVSFQIAADRPVIFTIIGESGSGKSTLARMILNIAQPTSGFIVFRGTDLKRVRGSAARHAFMRQVQPIFQNPFEAFNPLKRLDHYLYVTARRFAGVADPPEIQRRADRALRQVGLSLPEVSGRFPHELSGGQLQRVSIARALLANPALIVADEPVSMVDASLRVSIVNLFRSLRDELGISTVYITHDLATAYYISNELIIMQRGKVVESGPARAVLSDPQHPYSRLLKDAVLSPPPPVPIAAHSA